VSERTLGYAFKDVTGISPAAYLRAIRLNRVRRGLLHSAPGQTLVKTIACEHGFWHLGQFSHDYRQLFGQSPSETLRAERTQAGSCPKASESQARTIKIRQTESRSAAAAGSVVNNNFQPVADIRLHVSVPA